MTTLRKYLALRPGDTDGGYWLLAILTGIAAAGMLASAAALITSYLTTFATLTALGALGGAALAALVTFAALGTAALAYVMFTECWRNRK